MCGENIRTIEQVEKELKAVTWHIGILKSLQKVESMMAIREIDLKIKSIDEKLARLGNAKEN